MLHIDGQEGEGGGQVVRTSLALALITQTPITIENVRGGRKKPGLLRQHLTALRAIREISGSLTDGETLGSRTITVLPAPAVAGRYRFDIGSAGSANLVLQTLLPPLLFADGTSELRIIGGTHNDKSPPADFLVRSFLPLLRAMGADVTLTVERFGFFPRGGGELVARIRPVQALQAITLPKAQASDWSAEAIGAHVDPTILERLANKLARNAPSRAEVRAQEVPSPGPGVVGWLAGQFEHHELLFTGFGRRGLRADQLAKQVARTARRAADAGVQVDEYLADQLLLPMALAGGGRFVTEPLSLHSTTNAALIARFLPVVFDFEAQGASTTVTVRKA